MTVYRSATQNGARVAGTAGLTINKPSGVANGDVLVAFIGAGDELGGAYACSGWTQASGTGTGAQATTVGNDIGSTVLYKYISDAAGEPTSYTFANTDTVSQNRVGFIVCVQGPVESSDPIDELTQSSGSNDFTPTHVNITTGYDNCTVLMFHVANTGTTTKTAAGAPATPSGTTLIGSLQGSASTANYTYAEAAYYEDPTAGALTIGAWTGTADDSASEWHVYSVSIKPQQAEQYSGSAAPTVTATPAAAGAKGASGSVPLGTAAAPVISGAKGASLSVEVAVSGALAPQGVRGQSGTVALTVYAAAEASGLQTRRTAVKPNGVSLSNLSGAYTDIDETPASPDGNWLLFAA